MLDGNGRRIDVGHMDRDRADPLVIHVPLERPAAGLCRVTWRAVNRNGRAATGEFSFVVGK